MAYAEHHLSVSPLCELKVGLVLGFVLDIRHLLYLGVMRRLLNRWVKGPRPSKLSHQQIELISCKLLQLARYVPSEFARKPRSLQEMDRWKATEFWQFLLYTGIIALKSELEEEYYHNFLCLSVAVFILSDRNLLEHYLNYADQLFEYFVVDSMRLYGQNVIVYNVHNLTHTVDDVRKYGCLDSVSSFPFESILGRVKECVKSLSLFCSNYQIVCQKDISGPITWMNRMLF